MLDFLRRHGLVAADEVPPATALSGGVSSDIWRVDLRTGPVCVKRALPRLKVAQLWEVPVERNRYERMWMETANAIIADVAPKVLAADDTGCFAMQLLEGYPLWKAELAGGRADREFAAKVGSCLARIHAATAGDPGCAAKFDTDRNFHAIRLEPYLLAAGRVHASLERRLQELSERTARTKLALVHGDVSPKNILVGPDNPVFLDAECAWYGDPAFDLAFCLNHLLLKGLWVPGHREAFLVCFDSLLASYKANLSWEKPEALEQRAAGLLAGLLLARVDGKSPVEYLKADADRDFVRGIAGRFLRAPPATLAEVRAAWQRS